MSYLNVNAVTERSPEWFAQRVILGTEADNASDRLRAEMHALQISKRERAYLTHKLSALDALSPTSPEGRDGLAMQLAEARACVAFHDAEIARIEKVLPSLVLLVNSARLEYDRHCHT